MVGTLSRHDARRTSFFGRMGTLGRGADVLIHRLKVAGLLSFGPDGIDLPLKPLNVLIGPNGSGKSNTLLAGGDAEAGGV